jgi:hypothetical protein
MDDKQARSESLTQQRDQLVTVKEYAYVTREHPLSVYRRIREGRQAGVHRFGGVIRLNLPKTDNPV